MSEYKIHKSEGAPDWFVPGIECECGLSRDIATDKDVIVWFRNGMFFGETGVLYPYARPVEQWEPVEDEWCVFWDTNNDEYFIGRYIEGAKKGSFFDHSGWGWNHIARLEYPDGRVIDVTGGIEAIKQRTDWI